MNAQITEAAQSYNISELFNMPMLAEVPQLKASDGDFQLMDSVLKRAYSGILRWAGRPWNACWATWARLPRWAGEAGGTLRARQPAQLACIGDDVGCVSCMARAARRKLRVARTEVSGRPCSLQGCKKRNMSS